MSVNGLVSNTATPTAGGRLGTAVPDTHLFGMTKGQDGGDTSSYGGDDVNAELFEAFDRLFPDIERDYLRTITEMVNRGTGPGVGSFGPQTRRPVHPVAAGQLDRPQLPVRLPDKRDHARPVPSGQQNRVSSRNQGGAGPAWKCARA